VISNKADASGLERARQAGIETLVRDHKASPSREAFEQILVDDVKSRDVELVCLAGFMRLLGATFVDAFPNAILNIHPALLPAFPGLHAQRQALEHGAKIAGATVHFVDTNLDAGPIILQAAVPVLDADTEDTLSVRILEQEHRLYPAAVQRILDGHWTIQGRRVVFDRNEHRPA
jgi:phosphoribosylglycinamide formyltransferase-1